MNPTVQSWIDDDRPEALRSWLEEGHAMALSKPEKGEWARAAALRGRADVLRTLAEACHGLSLEPDSDGRTLLHHAAASGDPETMRFACRVLGFSARTGDRRGVTPLDLARAHSPEALHTLESLSGVRLKDCYRNPVLRGFHPDPSIVRVGNAFYLINSTFAFLPALPVHRSFDLVHWEPVGHVFTDPETAGLAGLPGGFGYWAPDLSYDGQRFWVAATLRRPAPPLRLQMITSAPSPEGPWRPPVFVRADGIDPSIFTDDDGQRYLVLNPGVQIAPLNDDGTLAAAPHMIYYGSARRTSEGPHLLKKDGWYYIFQAEGGTGAGHMITCARARTLDGPFDPCPFNPILGPVQPGAYIGHSGHGKPVTLPDGRWAIPYLCTREVEGRTLMGRETAVDPLEWTPDGWPMVNRLRGPSCLQEKLMPDVPAADRAVWICPRLDPGTFGEERDGVLRLTAGAPLSSLQDAHLWLHRQAEARVTQSAIADVSGLSPGGTAGLAGYYDEGSHYLFGLRRKDHGAALVLIEQAGPESSERVLASLPGTAAHLAAEGTGFTRTLRCPEADVRLDIRIDYLMDGGSLTGKRFTGATLGAAAVGQGEALFTDYREVMTDELF